MFLVSRNIGKLLIVLATIFLLCTKSQAGQGVDAEAILQWSPGDSVTLRPEEILEDTSTLLDNKAKLPAAFLPRIYELRGWAFLRLQKYEDASIAFGEWSRPDTGNLRPVAMRLRALAHLRGPDAVLGELRDLVRRHPNSAPLLTTLAISLGMKGTLEPCVDYTTKAIAADPEYAAAYYVRAVARHAQGDYRKSLEDLNRYLAVDPLGTEATSEEDAYLLRGYNLLNLGKPQDALSQFAIATRLQPGSHRGLLGLWRAYRALRRDAIAYRVAEKLIKAAPKDVEVLNAFATSCWARDEYKKAQEAAATSVGLDPRNAEGHAILGKSLFYLRRYPEAQRHLEKALGLDPKHWDAVDRLSEFLSTCPEAKYRDGKRAAALAQQLCEHTDRKRSRPLLLLANAKAEVGAFEDAIRFVQEARALNNPPHGSAPYDLLLRLYEKRQAYHHTTDSRLPGD